MNPAVVEGLPAAVIRRTRTLMQFGQTQRYHTELLLKPQDVAQHSYNVAWLCWELSSMSPSANLIMAALSHDAGERWTGDMPAPAKRAIPGMRAALDKLEMERVTYHGAEQAVGWNLTGNEARILKLADALEGAHFCLRELKLGNRIIVDVDEGGAGIKFMSYVAELLAATPDASGQIMYNHLKEEYDEFSK